jgi:hypothetical protein
MLDKMKSALDSIIYLDKNIGLKKAFRYLLLIIFIWSIFNYKTVLKDCIELITEISESIHSDKMKLRDELLSELGPILTDFRSNVRADRILYFEYHNSKENLIGIPFKYLELVRQNQSFSVQPAREDLYQNINTGSITNLYEDIKLGNLVHCSGPEDSIFHTKYPGVYNMFNSRDGAREFIFISIPGINTPVGMIVLEWMNESTLDLDLVEITHTASHNYVPRINALILSKRLN